MTRKSLKTMVRFAATVLSCTGLSVVSQAGIESLRAVQKQDVVNFCGTANVKLAFNFYGSGICYIDFSEAATDTSRPPVHVIPNTTTGSLPVVSPDGQWVTYADGVNGDRWPNASTVYICAMSESAVPALVKQDAGYVPRFAFNDGGTPTVVYSTCSYSTPSAGAIWDVCGTVEKVACPGGVPGSPIVVWADGGYLGGLSYDERYLATAENSAFSFILDMNSTAGIPATTPLLADSCDTLRLQNCNPSISSSSIYTDAMLCLSTQAIHPAIGRWGFHDRIFMVDSKGRILQYYDAPAEIQVVDDPGEFPNGEIVETEWDASEWSSHPYYAAASVKITRTYYDSTRFPPYTNTIREEMAYAINLKDSTHQRLLEVTDTSLYSSIRFPGLWVEKSPGFTEEQGWLEPVKYTPDFAETCFGAGAVDTGSVDTSSVPVDDTAASDDFCGTGVGLALIPPLGLQASARLSRRKRKRRSKATARDK